MMPSDFLKIDNESEEITEKWEEEQLWKIKRIKRM